MREVLFRGFSEEGQKHYGYVTVLEQAHGVIPAGTYISNRVGMPFAYKVLPETVGQSTGLRDTASMPIFEGDIVEFVNKRRSEEPVRIGVVVYDRGHFMIRTAYVSFSNWLTLDTKVIGNTHQHMHLFENYLQRSES